ncbi:hypothetical protein PRN20_01060 [Devosia sp. ZB163]|uniref:hypothetical protein n=1 Tax=Devosia sp. ZB163 TaxID=3025938 RepID=UPI0023617CB5|nr:hypothetical protein [Devosia sp. ZB163]MDC9822305.1 hypothetical protein [Devosia sp. ZB163]
MTTLVISAAVALFLLLALLLVSLNLFSLWKWWVKAAAIVVTLGSVVVLYFAMTNVVGWATTDQLPARFSLLHTRIVEPDKLRGLAGRIYLWVEQVDDKQVVISPPRAYEVPYEVETASEVATAQQQIEGGGKVLGQFAATGSEAPTKDINPTEKGEVVVHAEGAGRREGGPSGEGIETVGDPGALTFSEMPPVELPNKAVIQVGQ